MRVSFFRMKIFCRYLLVFVALILTNHALAGITVTKRALPEEFRMWWVTEQYIAFSVEQTKDGNAGFFYAAGNKRPDIYEHQIIRVNVENGESTFVGDYICADATSPCGLMGMHYSQFHKKLLVNILHNDGMDGGKLAAIDPQTHSVETVIDLRLEDFAVSSEGKIVAIDRIKIGDNGCDFSIKLFDASGQLEKEMKSQLPSYGVPPIESSCYEWSPKDIIFLERENAAVVMFENYGPTHNMFSILAKYRFGSTDNHSVITSEKIYGYTYSAPLKKAHDESSIFIHPNGDDPILRISSHSVPGIWRVSETFYAFDADLGISSNPWFLDFQNRLWVGSAQVSPYRPSISIVDRGSDCHHRKYVHEEVYARAFASNPTNPSVVYAIGNVDLQGNPDHGRSFVYTLTETDGGDGGSPVGCGH